MFASTSQGDPHRGLTLRGRAERKIGALWDAVGALMPRFTPAECANYFRAAGYDPD